MTDHHTAIIGLLCIIAIFLALIAWMVWKMLPAKPTSGDPLDGYPLSRRNRETGDE